MNNLTTRKIVLGMLATLVLAFSVQGTADALKFSRSSNSGDLQTALPNQPNGFKIRFSVPPGGDTTAIKDLNDKLIKDVRTIGGANSARIDSSGYLIFVASNNQEYRLSAAAGDLSSTYVRDVNNTYTQTNTAMYVSGGSNVPGSTISKGNVVDDSGAAVYIQSGPGPSFTYPRATAAPDAQVPKANRYHYNEEAIKIAVVSSTDGTVYITKVGSYEFTDTGKAEHDLLERGTDSSKNKLGSGVEVTFNATAAGVVTITITDETPLEDAPTNGKANPIQFTVYVVKQQSAVQNQATTFVGTDGVEYGYDTEDPQLNSRFDFVAADAPVYYTVEGSGQVYISLGGTRRTSPTKALWTSSEAPVYLDVNRGTNKVNAYISGNQGKKIIYIFSGPTPDKYPGIEITQGNNQTGATEARLEDSLKVRVTDGNNRPVPGVAVGFTSVINPSGATADSHRFIPFPGTTVYGSGSSLTTAIALNSPPFPDLVDNTADTTRATANQPGANTAIFVQTGSDGAVEVYFQLSDATGAHQINANLHGDPFGLSQAFDATGVDASRSASLVLVSGDNQSADAATKDVKNPLVVRVRRPGGYRIADVTIRFTALTGVLEPARGTTYAMLNGSQRGPDSGQEIYVSTNAHGEAGVVYNAGQIAGAKTVTARVDDEEKATEYDFQIRQVEFGIDGGGSSTTTGGGTTGGGTTPPPVTVFVPSSISGTPGGTATLRLTAPGTSTVTIGQLGDTFPSVNATTPVPLGTTFTSILTLPSQPRIYSLTVFVGGTPYSVSVTVSQTAGQTTSGTLDIETDVSGSPGESKPITVTATNSNGTLAANVVVRLRVTTGGGSFSPSSVTTGDNGTATSTFIRGNTVGSNYFISATTTPTGYNTADSRGIRITIATTPGASRTTVGPAAELDVYDGNNQDGSLNSRLAEPFVVEVVDANDNPVEDVRVRFRTTIGTGRFSPRTSRTDEDGFAETIFTPTSAGRIRISASVAGVDDRAAFTVQAGDPADALVKVSGDNQSGTPGNALAAPFVVEVQDEDGEPIAGHSVTFSVTAGGGSLSETSATADEDGLAETTLTLGSQVGINSVQASVSGVDPVIFSTSIDAKILVAAANRPVMYWIAGGGLYSLSGAKEAKIAESANGVAVGGGKIYWTEMTGESGGTVNSANLNGTDVTELASIFATPIGIAVDAAGSKLYWTNASGRIQSANLNGSGIKNVMQNLSDPTDIVVSNGFIYWTEGGNSVRRVNISGQKIATDVAVNLNTVGGLAVGGGKVYWTEQTSASAGTVNGSNLNGTNFEALATLLSAPMGISVDTAGSKLYWTNARGRVQSANLDGSMIKNVVEGLISPSKIVIGGANTEITVKTATPAKKDNAKYDVNGDGKVDNVDASLVASGLDTGNAKYDVNSDGTVNFLDLLLIFDNRDADAAAAPAIVGMKLSAVQIDRIEEQIDLLISTNDRSPAAMRTLVYLQQLLATARPEKTQLFANYPNPFNPETWIPYELATDTHVKITIYNTQGVVIRTLQFGHQSAGYYTDRDRAAYWDGRNALGEQVASGLYFYQLETDEMSSMRKMVILK